MTVHRRRLPMSRRARDHVDRVPAKVRSARRPRVFLAVAVALAVPALVGIPVLRSRPGALAWAAAGRAPQRGSATEGGRAGGRGEAATAGGSCSPPPAAGTASPGSYVLADPPVTGQTPSHVVPASAGFHEFQANC